MEKDKKDKAKQPDTENVSYEELEKAAKASASALMEESKARAQAEELLEELQAKCDDNQDALLRLQAEFDNFRRRTQGEIDTLFSDGIAEAIKLTLPMIDNLQRAYDAAQDSGDENISKGIKMCIDQFMDTFAKKGMEEIPALGEDFDPNVHEAITQEPCTDKKMHGKVADVLQAGYTFKGKVLRYSVVKVYE